MEKLVGKLVQTDGVQDFVSDFLDWAGDLTANALLALDESSMELEIVCELNADDHLIVARGLQGGGQAVAGWADAEGFDVLDDEDDFVSVEAAPDATSKTASEFATFLAPMGRWRITDVSVRRKA